MRELDEDLKLGDLVIFKELELTVKVKVSSGARVYMQVAEDEKLEMQLRVFWRGTLKRVARGGGGVKSLNKFGS